jgi:SAM-dependent methyltransferase
VLRRTLERTIGTGPDGIRWLHRLPAARPIDRERELVRLATGRRVIHIGFVDEHVTAEKRRLGVWLHDRLAAVARELVGLDVDAAGVDAARADGFEAYAVDCQDEAAVRALALAPAEVVIAGEVLEHLDAPGPFLRALHHLTAPGGTLVLTTPNAFRAANLLFALTRLELVHPDHTSWQSPRTLRTLLERAGWEIDALDWYQSLPELPPGEPASTRALYAFKRAGTVALRVFPAFSDGLFVRARRGIASHGSE